ncbi:TIGR04283 family arsenosugar biosynthesis glycosyltransferase [Flagellimonas pacifica]|uniref:Transferase 2, rSAM/selenodomain-associated n=1 Tax=Flagellimonas pacifica TaxID=1247520 RepID=A0A285MEX3_9FLAO|nr:TIGR04283 family arsenosugar biosynthesis glycosyltransferase [Allomuricauda parva]SNY94516.1 transferase 2, rSAM/selenodomain-associated [Allomuricauda parva]
MKPNNPSISIIIPVLNEEKLIGKILKHIGQTSSKTSIMEVICVDGGSRDKTISIAGLFGAKVIPSKKGRARQMNLGAQNASGEVLYFLHADTFTPNNFDQLILDAIKEGYESGCFRMRFDTKNPILRLFAWLSRINHTLCRGGDQSLFIKRNLFHKTKGFNEDYLIYEDTEFIQRLYKQTKFKVLPNHVITSARKYREKGWLKVQFHFGMIHLKNYLGAGPDELYRYYSKKILN